MIVSINGIHNKKVDNQYTIIRLKNIDTSTSIIVLIDKSERDFFQNWRLKKRSEIISDRFLLFENVFDQFNTFDQIGFIHH